MVASYHIQHPSLYSPGGPDYAKGLLEAFLIENYCANVERWARSIHEALQAAAKPKSRT
jgi:hypothetical protein